MNSQLLVGGRKIEDTPQFRSALEEQQKIIRQQYEKRLQDLEKERTLIEEDKAQVDRYKQLLLKQRDIMIALTTRLNERDETIIQLQEELDAYDRIHRETEENLESKKNKADRFEQLLKEHNIPVSYEQEVIIHLVRMHIKNFKKSTTEKIISLSGTSTNKIINKNNPNQQYNPDVVTYDGEETYNVTKGNLLDAEEKINELTKLNISQKQEILKLKRDIQNLQENENDENNGNQPNTNEIMMLQEQIKKFEQKESNFFKIIQKKGESLFLF